jgi:drug/metabolite transporter (DMT)-like permease
MSALLKGLWARPLLLLWLPPLFWAGNLVLGRALGPSFPPVSLAVGRWLVALACLAPFIGRQAWRERALLRQHLALIVACGAFGIAGYNALGYLALRTTPAASVAFLNSTLPLMVPLAAFALGVERVSGRTLAGIAVSFAGVVWIVARGDLQQLSGLRADGGEFLVLIAVANYSARAISLSLNFWSLPGQGLGTSTKTTGRGHLNEASRVLHQAMISSCVADCPGFNSTKAQGVSPHFSSGRATTAAACTAGCL